MCRNGTKAIIEQYHNEVIKCVQAIYYYEGSKLTAQKKLEFFAETRHSYGRTALMLSGGGGFGKFHYGVIKALSESDLLPRIIVGSSIGACVATHFCLRKLEDIGQCFLYETAFTETMIKWAGGHVDSYVEFARRLAAGTELLCWRTMKEFLHKNTGDITFKEIYEQFGWILNITVTDLTRCTDFKLLNYLTTPNVVVWSACLASCAIPGFYRP